jgi:hypothetical protein
MTAEFGGAARALRTPRAAAVAGIVFSILLVIVLIIIHSIVPADAAGGAWLTDTTQRHLVAFALDLVPFVGIAFLWFIGAVRDHVGDAEDRFFATVFLGSGVLFVAMLFVGTTAASSLVAGIDASGSAVDAAAWEITRHTTFVAINVYAMRMAAVFTVSTTSITARLAVIPRWLMIYGYVTAVVLLLSVSTIPWIELLFPLWVFVLSIHLLRTRFRAEPTAKPEGGSQS